MSEVTLCGTCGEFTSRCKCAPLVRSNHIAPAYGRTKANVDPRMCEILNVMNVVLPDVVECAVYGREIKNG